MALGFSIKAICEPAILNESVSIKEKPRSVFTKIDSKGSSRYYYLDAITAIACGFLFVFNNYLPMIICFAFTILSVILSYKFSSCSNTPNKDKLEETGSFKVYFKDLKIAFKNILRSRRLKALFLFCGMFYAMITLRSTISNSLLVEIGVEERYFGVISFFLTLIAGIASKNQNFFHKKFKNRVLSYFSMIYSICMIIAGLCSIIMKHSYTLFFIVICSYALWNIVRAPYYTLQKRYLNSFSSPKMSSKIYSACILVESIFATISYWIGSFMLDRFSTSFTIVIMGCVFTIAFVFILDYMKDKIGLKPEEYDKKDIELMEIK